MLGLISTSTLPAVRKPLTSRQARRFKLAWKAKQFFVSRMRELPMEVALFATKLAAKVVPGLNVPAHGRLYATVFRSHVPGLQAVGMTETEAIYKVREHTVEAVQAYSEVLEYQVGELIRVPLADALESGRFEVVDLGHVGCHLIVTAGKNYLASAMDNTVEPETIKYHGYGTGATAANVADTALVTELTTEYAVNSTRPTGSQAHSAATYTTVGTLSPDSGGTLAITEWGLFSATSSTTLYDRQVFSAVNLVASADSLATTYVLTFS